MINSVAFSPDGRQVVTGSRDGTTRIWDVNTARCLVILVSLSGGQDWLAVTPEGYFDGSEGGIAELGLCSRKSGEVLSESEKIKYHRPDKIREALQ